MTLYGTKGPGFLFGGAGALFVFFTMPAGMCLGGV